MYLWSNFFNDDSLFPPVDARTLTIPGGKIIILIIREGVPYIPNPELAKILPNVTRTAMEVIRNTYGIIVEQVRHAVCQYIHVHVPTL